MAQSVIHWKRVVIEFGSQQESAAQYILHRLHGRFRKSSRIHRTIIHRPGPLFAHRSLDPRTGPPEGAPSTGLVKSRPNRSQNSGPDHRAFAIAHRYFRNPILD